MSKFSKIGWLLAGLLVAGNVDADERRILSYNKLGVVRDGVFPRIFAISLYDKQLVSVHEKSGTSQWYTHATNPWDYDSDVSALSWYTNGYFRRVFGLSESNQLVVYQEDDTNGGNSVVSYLTPSNFGLSGTFVENVTSLDLGGTSHDRYLGVRLRSSVGSDQLAILKGVGSGGTAADTFVFAGATSQKLRPWSALASAKMGSNFAFWGISDSEDKLLQAAGSASGGVTLSSIPIPPLVGAPGALAATSYSVGADNFAALVFYSRSDLEFHLLIWKNSFANVFRSVSLGQITGGIANKKNALAISAHTNGLEVLAIGSSLGIVSRRLDFSGNPVFSWEGRGKGVESSAVFDSVALIPDPVRYPNPVPPGISLTAAVYTGSATPDEAGALGYVFEERSNDAIISGGSSTRKIRNHVDHGAISGIVNPIVNFGDLRIRRAWTESYVAENKGIMMAAAMVPPLDLASVPPSEHMNVEAAFSDDDGHHWDYLTVPKAFPVRTDRGITQGDPTTAVDDDGNSYVMAHEIFTDPECVTTSSSVNRFASYIYVYKKALGSNILVLDSSLSKNNNPWYLEDPEFNDYLDHPQMVHVGRDLHFTWLIDKVDRIGDQIISTKEMYYRTKIGNTYNSRILVSNNDSESGPPYIISDRGGNVYIYWQDDVGAVRLCDTRTINSVGCAVKSVTGDVNVQTFSYPFYANIDGISIRSGHMQFARGASANHIVGVWLACAAHVRDGISSIPSCPTTNRHVVFTQSYDAGTTWSPIEILTTHPHGELSDQFDPTVFVQNDGGTIISYWSNKGMTNKKIVKRVFHIKKPDSTVWEYGERASEMMDVSQISDRCNGFGTKFNGDYHIGIGGQTRGHFLWSSSKESNNRTEHQLNISTISWSTWK